jgi:molybdopterin molybdotransferase
MAAPKPDGSAMEFCAARTLVESRCAQIAPPATSGRVPLLEGAGRVLGEAITADRDFPPFDRATRDGYAIRAADVSSIPVKLKLAGQVKAGSAFPREIRPGECVEIMTGAPLPRGADAVVMVEYTRLEGGHVQVERSVGAGENVVPRGAEAKAGAVLLVQGTVLHSSQIAMAAAVGRSSVKLYAKPRVAVLSTGDEIVETEQTPGEHQIRNSNAWSLAAQIAQAGGEPVRLPIAPDEPKRLRELIEEGLTSDLLLLSGGVSMGKYDLVERVLEELGAEFFFTGCKMQPGKPVVFGRGRDRYFFGLPGNPISTMVTFDLFAKPLVRALAGAIPEPFTLLQAQMATEFKTKPGLTRFLPAELMGAGAKLRPAEVRLIAWQGSGDLAASARANCYIVVPPQCEYLGGDEMVSVLLR